MVARPRQSIFKKHFIIFTVVWLTAAKQKRSDNTAYWTMNT